MADTSVKVSFIGDAKKLSKTIGDVDKDLGGLGNKAKGFGQKLSDSFGKVVPVLAGVGAGVAVLSSAVQAAIEDEAEAAKLAETLKTVAGATTEQIAATEKWIDVTQRATGVSDSELRPALDTLVRSSDSLTEAQKNLGIAMDVARGTGKDLDTVSQALAKVLEGNTGAAARLVPELTGIAREGASADEVMASLAETFRGQTAAHANTTAGKLERINIAFDEMKERVGTALLPKLTEFGDWMLETGIPKIEETADKIAKWWSEQDELKKNLKETAEQTAIMAQNAVILAGNAAKAYDKIAPLVDILWELYVVQQKLNPLNAFGQGRSVNDIIADRSVAPGKPSGGGDIYEGRASGGPVMAGRSYVVGEKGPEVLHMGGRSGWVTPNGGGINVYVQGSVLSERDLIGVINEGLRRGLVIGG